MRITYHKSTSGLIEVTADDVGITVGHLVDKSNAGLCGLGLVHVETRGVARTLKLDRVMHQSVAFAFDNPGKVMDFVRCNAQEMEDEVMLKHIHLYVNNYTLELGPGGRKAIACLFDLAHAVKG